MMDLSSYLAKSKGVRQELVRTADKYLSKALSVDANETSERTQIYSGPNPQRFQMFKFQLDEDLQKIFRPESGQDAPSHKRATRSFTNKERIQKVYSGNHRLLNKKQLVIIPKRSLEVHRLVQQRLFPDKDPPQSEERTIPKPSSKMSASPPKRNSLFLPVLSTIGSHEERNKLYKYM